MAFGERTGPPARKRQIDELLDLLADAGYADLRDARGAMGFTQRQANGKFTVDEADSFIEQLQSAADAGAPIVATSSAPSQRQVEDPALTSIPSERLAAELQRRGWAVIEP